MPLKKSFDVAESRICIEIIDCEVKHQHNTPFGCFAKPRIFARIPFEAARFCSNAAPLPRRFTPGGSLAGLAADKNGPLSPIHPGKSSMVTNKG